MDDRRTQIEETEALDERFGELIRTPYKSPAELKEKERVKEALRRALQRESRTLFEELLVVGIGIESIWDFVNTADSYPEAIPILVKHLSIPYHRKNKEGIVRALAVKEAKGIASRAIMEEYDRTPKDEDNLRWVLGNTMSVIATEKDLDGLVEIVLNESNGDSRQMFVRALARLKSQDAFDVLTKLMDSESALIASEAAKAVKMRSQKKGTSRV